MMAGGFLFGKKMGWGQEIALLADAWGPQDAGHAVEATGRRVFNCPGIGRVLSRCDKEAPATYLQADMSQMNKLSFSSLIHSLCPTGVSPFRSVANFRVERTFHHALNTLVTS